MNFQNPGDRMSSFFVLCFIVALGFSFLSCDDSSTTGPDFSASEDFSYKIAIKNLTSLELDAINGSVEIEGASNIDSVTIWGERRVESDSQEDADEHLEYLSVEMSESEDKLSIWTEQPEQSSGRNYIVEYNIQVPKSWQLDIAQVNGSITISSMENFLDVNAVNGSLNLEDISASVDGGVTNGSIDCSISLPESGTCKLAGVNSSIDLSIPQSTSAQFSARITSGAITLSNLYLQNQTVTPTSVTGTLGAGEGEIELVTVNGYITVTGL